MAGPQASLELGLPYGSYVNVGSNHTDMVDNQPEKIFHNSESIGGPDASPLQEAHSIGLDTDSQSTCTRKMHGVYEASARPEAAESSNVQLETGTDSSTSTMPLGNELKVVHTENNLKQNWSVKDTADVQRPVEGLCQNNLYSKAGFQNNLPPATNVDDILYSITKDCCSDTDFTFEARKQPDIVEKVSVSEENPFVQKTSGSTEEEVCNKQVDPEVPTEEEDQFPKSHKHDELPMDETSCVKNPFDLDDPRNDDLFELPTDSRYLEVPSAVVSRQQLDSASVTVDQPTVSDRTMMAEAQHNHNSNECMLPASSSGENGHPVGPKDTLVCSSAELVTDTHLADGPLNHRLQEDGAHANGIPFVLSQAAPMEFRTVWTSALGTGVENTQAEDATAKMMTAVRTTDNTEMKQADDTTATDTYAIKVEAKKLTEDTATKMNELQHCSFEEKQANSTKVSAVQSISNLEENKRTEGTNIKEMNAQVNGNDLEGKQQTNDTSAEKMNAIGCTDNFGEKICVQATSTKEMIAAQSTENVEENKQENTIVRQEGNNQKEEIAVTGGRLNSGRIHVPLKVLLAEASAENKVHKPSAKERVLSFRRRVSKNDNSLLKPGSPKSGSDGHQWSSPAKLPRKNTDKSSKGRKQPWMPFICCHSVR
ncbi:hypothetical protein EJB05_43640 [Eragrostis curvula]|uniref:Uncharacterized protein n=1 Tax=Eragrostis curvula TaxID=38414 RepID=A0A5J9TFI4_9POAL|nr:hypothetical protein EJB05_43640 [Eragrostis curvula]